MDRLKREGNPPVGQLASPVPQYKDVGTEDWEIVQGEAGASYVKDRDVLAKLIEVQSELEVVKAELAAIKAQQTDGSAKVTLTGHLPPSAMELTVNSWDDLPDPSEVPVGATGQLIGTFDVRQNTGSEWVEVVL